MIINVDKLVSEISSLASLPEVYMKIRKLIDDPGSDLDDFSPIVDADPGLTAAILRIVNSAFFGFPGKIDNIKRALNLIGIGQLHDLVLSLSAVKALNLPNEIEPLKVFWHRSIYCGALARLLAKKCRLADAESLFVIGLLHEIGHLVLFMNRPELSKQAVEQAQDENIPLYEVEQVLLGTDYAKVGKALMMDWNLPYKFHCVTGAHCEPDGAQEYQPETAIIHIAHMAAVNKFPGADRFQYALDQDVLDILKISEQEMLAIEEQAHDIALEMEKVMFGS